MCSQQLTTQKATASRTPYLPDGRAPSGPTTSRGSCWVLEMSSKQLQLTLSHSETVKSRFNTAASWIPPAELPAELLATSYVLVHQDGHRPLLAPLYNSPNAIL